MVLFRLYNLLTVGFFFITVLIINLIAPELGFKSLAFAIFSIVTLIIAFIPVKWGLMLTFFYIGLEGFLKVVSGYNPVIHLGSDILVIFLTVKVLFESLLNPESRSLETIPFFWFFVFHFIWVFICMFNPYGLGFIPSLAGSKVYVTMFLLYFFGFYQTKTFKDAEDFIKPFLFVVLLHTAFGIYQGMVGEQSVIGLHPGYAAQLEKFRDRAFRPFGLTNLPGGPAVYLSFCFPLALYVIFTAKSYLLRLLFMIFLPAGIFLFLLCQIRASLLKMIIACLIFLVGMIRYVAGNSQRLATGLIVLTFISIGSLYFLPHALNMYVQQNELNEQAIDRSLSAFDVKTVSRARPSVWPRFWAYVEAAPMGAGFSRIGGAAAKFTEERRQNPYFQENFFFADNFWIACLVEIGLPGMFLLTAILIGILFKGYQVIQVVTDYHRKLYALALFGSLSAMFIGLYASEGVLYNPDACFFWFFSGVLLRLPYLPEDEELV